jgi:histidinol phosphatase-like PHP family hydrolase
METVIYAAVEHGVAIEINARYRIPSPVFIRLARDAGARFCFGSNQHGEDVGKLEYPVKMVKECGLTQQDVFVPER